MGDSRATLAGLGLLLLAGVVVFVAVVANPFGGGSSNGDTPDRPPITVTGRLGSEKQDFMRDPEVQRILREDYGITVDFTTLGSIEQVRSNTTGQDFLWPSNEVALQIYKDSHGGSVKFSTIFNSPIVLYSWANVADALMSKGIVDKQGDVYYADLSKLVPFITTEHQWSELGLNDLYGRVSVTSTDPTVSNSGNIFAALLANMLAGGKVAQQSDLATVLPVLRSYYNSLGFLEQGSGDLFKKFTRTGGIPIIVGYESQILELMQQVPESQRQDVATRLRIVYPRPTVWASHPIIAVTDNGERLMNALSGRDPPSNPDDAGKLLDIAWQSHGFRSGLSGGGSLPSTTPGAVTPFGLQGIPNDIAAVMPLPNSSVLDAITEALKQ